MHYTLFDTAIGTCGVVWGEHGLTGVHLPDVESRAHASRSRAPVSRRASRAEPPPDVRAAIDGIVALLRGEKRDLREIVLDIDGVPAFNRRVYELARTIRAGLDADLRRHRACGSAARAPRAPSGRRSGRTRGPSSCPATACWPPTAAWAASRRPAAWTPSAGCWKSKASRACGPSRRCSSVGRSKTGSPCSPAHLPTCLPAQLGDATAARIVLR